jgi:hypothetical protein
MCAVQREFLRSGKEAGATGATTWTIRHAVVIAEVGNLLIEMRRGFDGERAVADLSLDGVPLATHSSLVGPYMRGPLILERATDPSLLLARYRELVSAWTVLGDHLHLVCREI